MDESESKYQKKVEAFANKLPSLSATKNGGFPKLRNILQQSTDWSIKSPMRVLNFQLTKAIT